ncbi:DUF6233 domain-containing protein [Streptomyces sp. TP-A0356]|uniref:DUF6233 domain-containing protein n=1 Tax=Streptomyces sp. TP-A0356 TaxID=1359208 RepID=UPI00352AFB4A
MPPDAPRLRVILAFLAQQIAENEAVGTLAPPARCRTHGAYPHRKAAGLPQPRPEPPQQRHAALPSFAPNRSQRRSAGTSDPIKAHEARVAMTDPNIEPCGFCRPDSELGILD